MDNLAYAKGNDAEAATAILRLNVLCSVIASHCFCWPFLVAYNNGEILLDFRTSSMHITSSFWIKSHDLAYPKRNDPKAARNDVEAATAIFRLNIFVQ